MVFQLPLYGLLVKEVVQTQPLRVRGLNNHSLSEAQMGDIEPHWVRGRVLWHIGP